MRTDIWQHRSHLWPSQEQFWWNDGDASLVRGWPKRERARAHWALYRVRECSSQLSPELRVALFDPGGGLYPVSPWDTELDHASGQRKHRHAVFLQFFPSSGTFSASRYLLRNCFLECFLLLNSNQFAQIDAWKSIHQLCPDMCCPYRNQKFLFNVLTHGFLLGSLSVGEK